MTWDDDAHPDDLAGRRALLVAVVQRALLDACGGSGATDSEQHLADRWIRSSRDFILICDLARLPGELIRTRYQAGLVDLDGIGNRQVHRAAA